MPEHWVGTSAISWVHQSICAKYLFPVNAGAKPGRRGVELGGGALDLAQGATVTARGHCFRSLASLPLENRFLVLGCFEELTPCLILS